MLRIAIAQSEPVSAPSGFPQETPGSPFPTLDANIIDAVKFVEQAVQKGAEVVIFPEYFLQGILNEQRQYLSFPSHHLESFVSNLAREHNISIVGSIVHGSTSAGRLAPPSDTNPFAHIPLRSGAQTPSQLTEAQSSWSEYIHSAKSHLENPEDLVLKNKAFFHEGGTGDLKGQYVKRNLWHPEREYLKPGQQDHAVFETKWGKAGFLICWDLSHPAHAQALADQGADLIFMPSYWLAIDSEPMLSNYNNDPNYERDCVSAMCLSRSFETETVWIMCNAGGSRKDGFMGGSGVWAPLRGKVGGFDDEEVGLRIVDIDLAVLKDARDTYRIREDWAIRQAW